MESTDLKFEIFRQLWLKVESIPSWETGRVVSDVLVQMNKVYNEIVKV